MDFSHLFTRFASAVSRATGDAKAFVVCVAMIVIWAGSGPLFHYSETWQLIINTSTTIITFLMVFLIQNTQNREGAAVQAKLDELIRASGAQNRFIGIEKLTQEEVDEFRAWCEAKVAPPAAKGAKRPVRKATRAEKAVMAVNAKAKVAAEKAV